VGDDNVIDFLSHRARARAQPRPAPAPERASTYTVRLELDQATPPIWRRLELASDLTLDALHDVVQAAMGWTDSHLHQFRMDDRTEPFLTDFAEEEGDEGVHERDVRLDQVLASPGDRLSYDYDFGDGWDHTIELEAVSEYDGRAARVLDGRRACPPEDCGGIPGHEEICELLAHPERADEHGRLLLDWLQPGYDPEAFSATEADELVQAVVRARAGSLPVALLDPVLAALVTRSRREPQPLATLIARAGVGSPETTSASDREQHLRPLLHFLDVVGPDGVALTQAGWLSPAVVVRLCAELDLLEPWMGSGNREQHLPPVRNLRSAAAALGLVRKHAGRLVLTPAGRLVVSDGQALWKHLATALPVGKHEHERHAGAVMLLAVAAGEDPYHGILAHGSSLMWSGGWAIDDQPPRADDALDWARPTWTVLRVLDSRMESGRRKTPSDALRDLARAALRLP
jgi:hypothetical protein